MSGACSACAARAGSTRLSNETQARPKPGHSGAYDGGKTKNWKPSDCESPKTLVKTTAKVQDHGISPFYRSEWPWLRDVLNRATHPKRRCPATRLPLRGGCRLDRLSTVGTPTEASPPQASAPQALKTIGLQRPKSPRCRRSESRWAVHRAHRRNCALLC